MTHERLLLQVGGFGRYQKKALVLMGAALAPTSLQLLMNVFILALPEFRCAIPGLQNDSYTISSQAHAELFNTSIPWDVPEYSQCYVLSDQGQGQNVTGAKWDESSSANRSVEKCDAWVFSRDIFDDTIVSQLNLVCDRRYVVTFTNVLTMAGLMVGTSVGGIVADLIGRRPATLGFTFCHIVGAFLVTTIQSTEVLYVMRFLEPAFTVGAFTTNFIWLVELVSPDRRVVAGQTVMFGWVLGMFLLAGLAFLFRHWWTLQLAAACVAPVFVLGLWGFNESPRWLLAKGRNSKAFAALRKIASENNTTMSEDVFQQLNSDVQFEPQTATLSVLVKSKVMCARLFILAVNWIVCSMVYYGLTLNLDSIIEGDLHTNFFILSLIELSANLFVVFSINALGRKTIYSSCILAAGCSCLATIAPLVAKTELLWINSVLANLGKFGVTAAFSVIWLFTAELLPTVVRTSGLGFCSFAGRVGSLIAPSIGDLSHYVEGPVGKALPLIVFGAVTVLAGLLSLLLPETRNRKLPQTIQEAKNIHKTDEEQNTNDGK